VGHFLGISAPVAPAAPVALAKPVETGTSDHDNRN
jgi:hypothetical protein